MQRSVPPIRLRGHSCAPSTRIRSRNLQSERPTATRSPDGRSTLTIKPARPIVAVVSIRRSAGLPEDKRRGQLLGRRIRPGRGLGRRRYGVPEGDLPDLASLTRCGQRRVTSLSNWIAGERGTMSLEGVVLQLCLVRTRLYWAVCFGRSWDIMIGAPENQMGHVTYHAPFRGWFVIHGL